MIVTTWSVLMKTASQHENRSLKPGQEKSLHTIVCDGGMKTLSMDTSTTSWITTRTPFVVIHADVLAEREAR